MANRIVGFGDGARNGFIKGGGASLIGLTGVGSNRVSKTQRQTLNEKDLFQ